MGGQNFEDHLVRSLRLGATHCEEIASLSPDWTGFETCRQKLNMSSHQFEDALRQEFKRVKEAFTFAAPADRCIPSCVLGHGYDEIGDRIKVEIQLSMYVQPAAGTHLVLHCERSILA